MAHTQKGISGLYLTFTPPGLASETTDHCARLSTANVATDERRESESSSVPMCPAWMKQLEWLYLSAWTYARETQHIARRSSGLPLFIYSAKRAFVPFLSVRVFSKRRHIFFLSSCVSSRPSPLALVHTHTHTQTHIYARTWSRIISRFFYYNCLLRVYFYLPDWDPGEQRPFRKCTWSCRQVLRRKWIHLKSVSKN